MDISVVIPLLNEEESLPELIGWIEKVMIQHAYSYEVILVDDGSKDNSWPVIESLAQKNAHVKGIKFKRNYGKSAALNTAFEIVQGKVVITMDADLQDSPDEIPSLYQMIIEEKYDIVSGWKKKRYDPLSKTIPTKIYNWTTRKVTGVKLNDMNCGLKAYRNEVVKSIEVYGEMHRYIPAIAKWAGYTKIGEKAVAHQARKYGKSKFGLERFINGFLDLMSITFVSKYSRKPMHFFGTLGVLMFLIGSFSALYLGVKKLYLLYMQNTLIERVSDSPYFYIALTAIILGMQLFLAGFLAEMISRSSGERNKYLIEKRIT